MAQRLADEKQRLAEFVQKTNAVMKLYPFELEPTENVQQKVRETKLNKFLDIHFRPVNSSVYR